MRAMRRLPAAPRGRTSPGPGTLLPPSVPAAEDPRRRALRVVVEAGLAAQLVDPFRCFGLGQVLGLHLLAGLRRERLEIRALRWRRRIVARLPVVRILDRAVGARGVVVIRSALAHR